METTRRNFLFGTVATAATATALVLKAPKEAVALFQPTLEETVALTRVPRVPDVPVDAPRFEPIGPGETVFNSRGEPVGVVTALSVENDPIDVTMWGDDTRHYIPGQIRGRLEVEMFSPVVRQSKPRFRKTTVRHWPIG